MEIDEAYELCKRLEDPRRYISRNRPGARRTRVSIKVKPDGRNAAFVFTVQMAFGTLGAWRRICLPPILGGEDISRETAAASLTEAKAAFRKTLRADFEKAVVYRLCKIKNEK